MKLQFKTVNPSVPGSTRKQPKGTGLEQSEGREVSVNLMGNSPRVVQKQSPNI